MEQSLKTAIHPPMDLATFAANAGTVADLLKALGNQRRLMVMCKLAEHGEMTVGALADEVGLSQSALSQHLARMRGEGLVAFRREGRSIIYTANYEAMRDLLGFLMEDCCAGEPAICMPISEMARAACRTC